MFRTARNYSFFTSFQVICLLSRRHALPNRIGCCRKGTSSSCFRPVYLEKIKTPLYFYCKNIFILIVVYVFLLLVHVFLTLSMYSYCYLCILIARPCILNVVYVYLLLSMYSYCSSMYS